MREMNLNFIHVPELLLAERDFRSAQVVIRYFTKYTLPEYYTKHSEKI